MIFNEKQEIARKAPENRVLITAPAGSGKTSTLIGAIEYYKELNPKDKVVAITFTKKAAEELQQRIKCINVETSTIHSWAYRYLQKLATKHNFKVQLLQEDAIKDILKKLCNIRGYYLNYFQLYSYICGNYNIDVDSYILRRFEQIYNDYQKFKDKHNLYDFTDLPKYLLDMLNEYEEVITDIDAIFVDEFQDLDEIQKKIITGIQSKKIVLIGDEAQNIYQFRGAGCTAKELVNNYNFTEYQLNVNYRSFQEIIDYANIIYKSSLADVIETITDYIPSDITDEVYNSHIICENGRGGLIYILDGIGSCYNLSLSKYCNDKIIISSLLADSHTMFLCRSNAQVRKLQSLNIKNVSTIHQAKGLEYDNVVLVDFFLSSLEEKNIAYVGMTRAKKILCTANYDALLYVLCQDDVEIKNNRLF